MICKELVTEFFFLYNLRKIVILRYVLQNNVKRFTKPKCRVILE